MARRPALVDALRGYSRDTLVADLMAGLVVGVVALPLAIAFAIASGADPRAGLVTVVVAGALAALLGGSRVQVTGPTGAFVVVLAGIAAEYGFAKLVVAVFMAGILLTLAGVFRLGRLIQFIPYPVTTGFTAGIAVVIFIGQLPDLLGLRISGLSSEPLRRFEQVAIHVREIHWVTFALAVATVLIILLVKRTVPKIPGPAVALAIGTAAAAFLAPDAATVGDRFASITPGLPAPHLPRLDLALIKELMPPAITIALLGAIESLLSAVVADGMTGQRHDPDQELIGQGVANMGSALFGGIAATGAIARTATNVQSGGRTPVSALVHAMVVMVVLYVALPYAAIVPMAVLAGILAVVAWNMSEPHRFVRLLKMPRQDAGVMVAVFLLTVLVDLTVAVTVGLLLSVGIFLKRMADATTVTNVDPFTDEAPPEHKAPELPPGVMVYSIDGPFFFGAADRFQETLNRVSETPHAVILRLRNTHYIDATAVNALEHAIGRLKQRGTRVMLAAINAQPLDVLMRAGFFAAFDEGDVYRTTQDAVDALGPTPQAPS